MRLRPWLPVRWVNPTRKSPIVHLSSTKLRTARSYSRMAPRTYDDAVALLNTLQTPHAVLQERIAKGIRIDASANEEMRKCLDKIGYTQNDLNSLSILHIAGTKGKGTTCAFISSILTQYPLSNPTSSLQKVGLFTSPHLIHVRERIRINNTPISPTLFAKYFFEVWDVLETLPAINPKPVYFRYLTLLSYHVFIQEKCDVAIYETGVGGEYDSTNIVDSPVATGISALGIDHTFSLGTTIESIAWHKAGIQKPQTPSFTVQQPPTALEVIKSRALEKNVSSLTILSPDPRLEDVKIKPNRPFQHANASLAIALTETFLKKKYPEFLSSHTDSTTLPNEFKDGLENVVWHGRCEKKIEGNITWYLDGAHTADSLKVSSKWFSDARDETATTAILIFNQQGHRDAVPLLIGFYHNLITHALSFQKIIFCPTVSISKDSNKEFANAGTDTEAITHQTLQKQFRAKWEELDSSLKVEEGKKSEIIVEESVEKAMERVRMEGVRVSNEEGGKIDVFVTGSVHLIGRVLGIMEDEAGKEGNEV